MSSTGNIIISGSTNSLTITSNVDDNNPQILLQATNGDQQLFFGYDSFNDSAYFKSIYQGVDYRDFRFNPGDLNHYVIVPKLSVLSTTGAVSATSASAIFAGGIGVSNQSFFGGSVYLSGVNAIFGLQDASQILTLANTTASTSSSTGGIQCAGGAYFGNSVLMNANLTLQGASSVLALSGISSTLTLANTTASTSSTTGALQCAGGAYFGAASLFNANVTINTTGSLILSNTTASTSSTTGALQCAGGAFFGAACRLNGNMVFQGASSLISLTGATSSISLSGTTSTFTMTQTGSSMTLAGVLNANGASSQTFTYGYLNSLGGTGTGSGTANYSILAANRIKASEFNAVSSKKIKTIQSSLSDSTTMTEAINLFKSIPLSKYVYTDQQRNDSYTHYGLIAEDMPGGIYTDNSQNGYVPNIYMLGTINSVDQNGICSITLDNAISPDKLSTITDTNYLLCYSSIDDGKTFSQFEVMQNFTIIDNTHITAFDPNFEEYDHAGVRLFIYGSQETIPNISKNNVFELALCVLQNVLNRLEIGGL